MKRMFVCLSLAAIIGICGCTKVENNPQAEAKALEAAVAWLALVDGEKYSESWVEASQSFRKTIRKHKWIQTMQSVRKPFGNNISRELDSKRYQTSLRKAPDGEYVILYFSVSFENKESTLETITCQLDSDGKWRVAGYIMDK